METSRENELPGCDQSPSDFVLGRLTQSLGPTGSPGDLAEAINTRCLRWGPCKTQHIRNLRWLRLLWSGAIANAVLEKEVNTPGNYNIQWPLRWHALFLPGRKLVAPRVCVCVCARSRARALGARVCTQPILAGGRCSN